MKKNIIVIFPIILSVITVAIFFNLSVKPMDTTTNVLGQKETMSQNENSKKNTIGNAAKIIAIQNQLEATQAIHPMKANLQVQDKPLLKIQILLQQPFLLILLS